MFSYGIMGQELASGSALCLDVAEDGEYITGQYCIATMSVVEWEDSLLSWVIVIIVRGAL